MTIEIHQPELEALIQQRMESGQFESVEDVLFEALKASPQSEERSAAKNHFAQHRRSRPEVEREEHLKPERPFGRKSLADLFAESPFRGLDIEFPRAKDPLRPIDL